MDNKDILEIENKVISAQILCEESEAILKSITDLIYLDEDLDSLILHYKRCYLLHLSATTHIQDAVELLDSIEIKGVRA